MIKFEDIDPNKVYLFDGKKVMVKVHQADAITRVTWLELVRLDGKENISGHYLNTQLTEFAEPEAPKEPPKITMPLADQRMLLQIAANLGLKAQMDVWANAPIILTPGGNDTMTFNPLEDAAQAMDLVCMYEMSWRWRRWLRTEVRLEVYGYDMFPTQIIPRKQFTFMGHPGGRPHFLRRAICEVAICYTTDETRLK